jgi:hypothetical protein
LQFSRYEKKQYSSEKPIWISHVEQHESRWPKAILNPLLSTSSERALDERDKKRKETFWGKNIMPFFQCLSLSPFLLVYGLFYVMCMYVLEKITRWENVGSIETLFPPRYFNGVSSHGMNHSTDLILLLVSVLLQQTALLCMYIL